MNEYKDTIKDFSTQRLREEFWHQASVIRNSREAPPEDTRADSRYGEARERLTVVSELLGERYYDDCFEMNGKPWHYYL